jgi:NTE family protein
MTRKRVGLALGGGGARGMAHVGVLQVLEREGFPIDCIAGTSVGSLVGAAYAAGLRGERLTTMALQMRWRDIGNLVWPRDGLVSFAKLESFLVNVMGDLTFADLQIPYAAVAANLAAGNPVILKTGRVAPAVRASCSVPGIVTPVDMDGLRLVDGGMANNLPISVVRDMGADLVIAVGLATPPGGQPRGIFNIGIATVEHLIIGAGDDPATADVYIPIPLWGLGSLIRLSAGEKLIALGRQAAEQALPAIEAALGRSYPTLEQDSREDKDA